jgi:hypothetical protein
MMPNRMLVPTMLLLASSGVAAVQQARPARLTVDETVLNDDVVVTAAAKSEETSGREIASTIISPPVSLAAVTDGLVDGPNVGSEDERSIERVEAELARATRTAQVGRR